MFDVLIALCLLKLAGAGVIAKLNKKCAKLAAMGTPSEHRPPLWLAAVEDLGLYKGSDKIFDEENWSKPAPPHQPDPSLVKMKISTRRNPTHQKYHHQGPLPHYHHHHRRHLLYHGIDISEDIASVNNYCDHALFAGYYKIGLANPVRHLPTSRCWQVGNQGQRSSGAEEIDLAQSGPAPLSPTSPSSTHTHPPPPLPPSPVPEPAPGRPPPEGSSPTSHSPPSDTFSCRQLYISPQTGMILGVQSVVG